MVCSASAVQTAQASPMNRLPALLIAKPITKAPAC